MKKLLVLGASNSTTSINKAFATYASSFVKDAETVILVLNDFEMPIYSPEREESGGVPDAVKSLVETIASVDGIILSLAEHNGSYSAAFKNVLDWSSRHGQKLWSNKPMLLLSTSPGGRGGATVLAAAATTFPHLGANVTEMFSLPAYYDNFSDAEGVTDADLLSKLQAAISVFSDAL